MSSRFAGRFGAAHHHSHNNPARESVPVWEQQWVLPTPGARIKVLKWVKSSDNKTRTFPETEDARYIYATNEEAAKQTQQQPSQQHDIIPVDVDATPTDANIHTTGAATSDEVAHVQPAAVEDGVTAADAATQPMDDPDETQGGHLFDETMKPVGDDDDEDEDQADVTKADVEMKDEEGAVAPPTTTTEVLPPPPAPAADEEEGEEGEEGGDEEDAGEEEEEEEAVDKHSTIRIGGPLPSADEPPTQPQPQPQVATELHPQPEAISELPTDSTMTTAEVEQDPASAVDTNAAEDPVITTVTRDDPDVKGLGEDIEAVVHEQPDGVQQVKVLEDQSASGAENEQSNPAVE